MQAAIDESLSAWSPFDLEQRILQENGSVGWTQPGAVLALDAESAVREWHGLDLDRS